MPGLKYLIDSYRDSRWGIVTTTVGQQRIPLGEQYPRGDHPHRYLFTLEHGRTLQEFQIIYITDGKGWFESAHQKRIEIRGGDILLLFPGEWHNYRPYSDIGWEESWIGFYGSIAQNLLKEGFFSVEKPVLRIGLRDELWSLFGDACRVAQEQMNGYQQKLAGIVCMLLGSIYAASNQSYKQDSVVIDAVNHAKRVMHENIGNASFKMEDVAKEIGMSYSRFRVLFRDYTGFAPAQFFQAIRIMKCKELLTNTNLTCEEITYLAGFEYPSYFNTMFRKNTGKTPLEYRKMTQGESSL